MKLKTHILLKKKDRKLCKAIVKLHTISIIKLFKKTNTTTHISLTQLHTTNK